MDITINNKIYNEAQEFAQQHGMNLNTVIEHFLLRLVGKNVPSANEEPIPDIVMSLLGAADPVAEDDLNGREAYYQYLEEKYK